MFNSPSLDSPGLHCARVLSYIFYLDSLQCLLIATLPSTTAGQRSSSNMPSLQSVLVLTTLVSSALAAPAPAQHFPRSFEVPRIRNVNAPKRDGAKAMANAFNKFGFGAIGAQKQGMRKAANGTTGKGDDGSVGTASANMGAEFLSQVTIGNQKFNMDFDTGSSDL